MNPPTPNRAALKHTAARILDALEKLNLREPTRIRFSEIAALSSVSERSTYRAMPVLQRLGFIRYHAHPGQRTTVELVQLPT